MEETFVWSGLSSGSVDHAWRKSDLCGVAMCGQPFKGSYSVKHDRRCHMCEAVLDGKELARVHARENGPESSAQAAKRLESFLKTHAGQIAAAMSDRDQGWTQTELAAATGLSREQVHKRLSDLCSHGLAASTLMTRPNENGYAETVHQRTRKKVADVNWLTPVTKPTLASVLKKLRSECPATTNLGRTGWVAALEAVEDAMR